LFGAALRDIEFQDFQSIIHYLGNRSSKYETLFAREFPLAFFPVGAPLNIRSIINFFTQDLWRIPLHTLPPRKSFLLKQLRIIILAFRGFDQDKCNLRASALTYFSLLSVVPVMALAFAVAKGFAMQKLLEKELISQFKGQEEIANRVIGFAHSMLENTKGGVIAGVGVLFLFYLIIKLLGNIESSFNDVWGIKEGRAIGRKLTDYLSIMFICPILFIMSSSVTVFFKTQVTLVTQKIALLGGLAPLISFLFKGVPYAVIWLLFTFIYIFIPNTRVRFLSGLLGGIVAGTIYVIVQWAYITFQIGVSKYGAIYGSFAALPLFLVWLQLSWLIVLFGAEISFASQNVDTYEFEPDYLNVSPSFKRLLTLRIAHQCIKDFCKEERAMTAEQLSHSLEVPVRLVHQILFDLVKSQVLSEIRETSDAEPTYQPGRDPDRLSISYVIQATEELGSDKIPVVQSRELEKISECLREFAAIVKHSNANLLLKDI
jgi:membrane protein